MQIKMYELTLNMENMLPTAMAMNSIAMHVFIVLIIELIFL